MIWKEDTRQKAQKLLQRRIAQGREISHMFESELIQNELALLGGFDSQSTLYSMTINDAIDHGNSSLDDFESAYENRVRFHNEIWTYNIYFPLYSDFPKRKLIVHGTHITVVPFTKVYGFFSKDGLIKAVRNSGISNFDESNIPSRALHFVTTGNNILEAWDKISGQFNLLRGLIDFTTLYAQINYTFGITSRTKNEHPQWGLMQDIEKHTTQFITFTVGKRPSLKKLSWSPSQRQLFTRLLRVMRGIPSKESSLNVLADCLRLYAQAMEAVQIHNCFLSLWQAAEALTRSEGFGGHTEKVLNRVEWHSNAFKSLKGLDISQCLKELAAKRNEIVHRGVDKVQNSDINLLKSLCDVGIRWLLDESRRLKTVNHLDEFYRLRTSNEKARKAIVETVKSLQAGVKTRHYNH